MMKTKTPTSRLMMFLVALVLAPMIGGCAMTDQVSYEGVDKGGSSFFLLGLWNVFSKGLDDVAANLNEEGYHAQSMPGPEWPGLCDNIVALEREGELRRPLVLSGHSLGADKVLLLCAALERRDIEVDYIILLDATNPRTVPANVHKCHNIYLSHAGTDWFPAFRGISVETVSEETELINYDVRFSENELLSQGGFDHFNIETDPEIQKLMTDLVRARFNNDPNLARILPPNEHAPVPQ